MTTTKDVVDGLACTKCQAVLHVDMFYKLRKTTRGYSYDCKPCRREYLRNRPKRDRTAYQRAWAKTPKGQACEQRRYTKKQLRRDYRLRKYGLTYPDYVKMRKLQRGRCRVCKRKVPGSMAVDHCHATGVVRGLLCLPCNRALGLLKDDVRILRNAVAYLERTQVG